jgi:cytoskeleton protein RodZ
MSRGKGLVESFGERLKREREKRKISLDDISVSTKIGTRFLVALEEDQFDQLPGGIFNKGFVRAYARYLGLDENQAIADFVAASAPVIPEIQLEDAPVLESMAVRVPESVRKNRGDGGIPWGGFAAVLLVLAFGFAVWGFYSREKSPNRGAGASKPAPAESSIATAPALPDKGNTSQENTSPATQAPASAPSSSPAGTATPAAGVFVVLVRAREDSWVSITADGKEIIQDTLTAPAEKSVEARTQIVVKTGNLGALDISFNGKKLPAQGSYNQVKTLTFDPNGLRP